MEQGRLSEAGEAYQKMLDLKPFYQSYTRAAHLRWLKGDLDGATDASPSAISSASPRDPESSAWAWTRFSAYELQAGRLRDAATAAGDRVALRARPCGGAAGTGACSDGNEPTVRRAPGASPGREPESFARVSVDTGGRSAGAG